MKHSNSGNFEKFSNHKDKKRCPDCNGVLLEETYLSPIIIKGEFKDIEKKKLICSKCDYEQEIDSKSNRKRNFTKTELVEKEPIKKYNSKRR